MLNELYLLSANDKFGEIEERKSFLNRHNKIKQFVIHKLRKIVEQISWATTSFYLVFSVNADKAEPTAYFTIWPLSQSFLYLEVSSSADQKCSYLFHQTTFWFSH